MHSIIILLRVLEPKMSEAVLTQRVDEMLSQGYRCTGVYQDVKLIGICGL